jgi:hypothetical protein
LNTCIVATRILRREQGIWGDLHTGQSPLNSGNSIGKSHKLYSWTFYALNCLDHANYKAQSKNDGNKIINFVQNTLDKVSVFDLTKCAFLMGVCISIF